LGRSLSHLILGKIFIKIANFGSKKSYFIMFTFFGKVHDFKENSNSLGRDLSLFIEENSLTL
jgi:hypothetical protein